MSALQSHVDDYLRLRRALGYDLEETGRLLHRFAVELDAAGVTHITTQVAVRWALAAEGERAEQCARDPVPGGARVRALHGRDRPTDGDPARRAGPPPEEPSPSVRLHRRAGAGVARAGASGDPAAVASRDDADADRAARRKRPAGR